MMQKLPLRPLGSQGMLAPAQGLGTMSLGNSYGDSKHKATEPEYQAVLKRALDLGATFIDTADLYGNGMSEKRIGVALKGRRDEFTVATKFGAVFTPGQEGVLSARGVDGSPAYVRKAVEDSLQRLGTDHIDLYYQHRVDRTRPIEETWGELKKLVQEGKVKYLGISEASPAEIRRAHAVHPITAVQLEWSLWTRNAEAELIPLLRELGIGIVAYSPLGRGFLTGAFANVDDLSEGDFRRNMPRFQQGAFERNLQLVAELEALAAKKGITSSQLALAWLHAQGDDVFPIPGTKRVKYLEQNVAAFHVKLEKEEVDHLSKLFAPDAIAGERYAKPVQATTFEGGQA